MGITIYIFYAIDRSFITIYYILNSLWYALNNCEIYGELENELDSVLDLYKKKQDETRTKEQKNREDNIDLENEFKNTFDTIVYPLMTQMVNYLETKGNEFKGSSVRLNPNSARISFIINPYRLDQGTKWAEIEFSRNGNKLKITEKNENSVNGEALFEKSDLNPHFVKRMLIAFVKSY